MKVFLTGGTGVIGRPTVAALVAAGHTVRAVARGARRRRGAAAGAARNRSRVDLFDATAVSDAVAGSEAIVHIATNVPPLSKMARPKGWDHAQPAPHRSHPQPGRRGPGGRAPPDREGVDHVRVRRRRRRSGSTRSPRSSPSSGCSPRRSRGRTLRSSSADGRRGAVVLRFGLFYGGAGNRGTDEMLKLAKVRGSLLAGNPDGYMSSIHAEDAGVRRGRGARRADRHLQRDRRRAAHPPRRRSTRSRPRSHQHKLHTNPAWTVSLLAGPAAGGAHRSQRVSNQKFRDSVRMGAAPTRVVREGWAVEARPTGAGGQRG